MAPEGEISSYEAVQQAKKLLASKLETKKGKADDSDATTEEPPAKDKAAVKKAESDESSDEEPAPKAKAKAAAPKKAAESDDSSDEEPAPKAKAKAVLPKKAAESDSSDEEPIPKAQAKAAVTKKVAESDDSSDEEPALKKAKTVHPASNDDGSKPEGKGKGKGDKGKGKGEKGDKGKSKGAERNDELTVFVRGLSPEVQYGQLKADFAKCGEIDRLSLPKNEDGTVKGIAFVQFTAAEGVEAALQLNEQEYSGKTMYVSKAGEGAKGKDGKGKGKDGKGKGKDGKDGKGKAKGKGKATSAQKAARDGSILEGAGTKQTFDSDDEEVEPPTKKAKQ